MQSSPEKPGTPLCLEIVSEIKNMYLIYFRISVEYGYVWGSYAIVLVVLPLVLLRVPKFINLSEQQLFFVALYVQLLLLNILIIPCGHVTIYGNIV